MVIFIIIVMLVVWFFSYLGFKHDMAFFTVMVSYLTEQVRLRPHDIDLRLRLSSALIQLQRYEDAHSILINISLKNLSANVNSEEVGDRIRKNISFCKNPVPGVNYLKNYDQSYWHNFMLKRFGRARYNFLTEEDIVKTEAIMSMLDKKR